MENSFNSAHEDLPTTFVQIKNTAAATKNHGTAVMSILGAKNNGFGLTGIAYGASLGFYGWGSNIANSIRTAADRLRSKGELGRIIRSLGQMLCVVICLHGSPACQQLFIVFMLTMCF